MYRHIATNKLKSTITIMFFFAFIVLIGFLIGNFFDYRYQSPGKYYTVLIMIIAFIVAFLSSFIGYFYSDKIVLQMTKARPLQRDEEARIYYMVEGLAIAAGIPVPKIYIIDEESMNAFATGRNPKNSVIALTRGLIDKLDDSELKGVIAHELSHIKNFDVLLGTILAIFVGMLSLISNILLRSFFFGGSRKRSNNKGGGIFSIILLFVGLILIILSPFIGLIIRLAVSRNREYLADSTGVLLTRYPAGLANALKKINSNSKIKHANTAFAHLFIANPIKKRSKVFFSNFFSTHPPVEERIRRLNDMALGIGINFNS